MQHIVINIIECLSEVMTDFPIFFCVLRRSVVETSLNNLHSCIAILTSASEYETGSMMTPKASSLS